MGGAQSIFTEPINQHISQDSRWTPSPFLSILGLQCWQAEEGELYSAPSTPAWGAFLTEQLLLDGEEGELDSRVCFPIPGVLLSLDSKAFSPLPFSG